MLNQIPMTKLREAAQAALEELARRRREAEADWPAAQYVPTRIP